MLQYKECILIFMIFRYLWYVICLLLQTLGIQNSKDRDVIKKKIKDMKSAIERERKQQEKEQKAREKLEKQAAGQTKKKKFPFTK